MLLTYLVTFNIGLFSAMHCVGMCGGIIGAMMYAVPDELKRRKLVLYSMNVVSNLGRISSYTIAGLLLSFLGINLLDFNQLEYGHLVIQVVFAFILILIGMNIAGWFPQLKKIEYIGQRFWRFIQPVGKKILPVDSILKAYLAGMLWGWVPCGLVYSVLLLSLASNNVLEGTLIMLSFGLGTLLPLVATGIFMDYLKQLRQNRVARQMAGCLIIVTGLLMPVSSYYFIGQHDQHTHHMHH